MSDYISKFTGAEIDESIKKAKEINKDAASINTSLTYLDTVKSDVASLKTGEVIGKKADGTLEGTGIINGADKIFFPKDGRFPSASIDVGPAITISENGGWAQYKANTLGKKYILLDYEIDATGTKRPIYWERAAQESLVPIQPVNSSTMQNVTTFDHVPTADSQVNGLYFDFVNPVSNFMIEIVSTDTGLPVKYIPNEAAWVNNIGGISLATGVQNVFVNTKESAFSALQSYHLKFNVRADQQVILKGSSTEPYIAVDRQLITAKGVLLQGEGTGSPDTAEQVRDKLISLQGTERLGIEDLKDVENTISGDYIATKLEDLTDDARLDASAIKNLPGGGGASSLLGLTDTPTSYAGKNGYLLRVKSAEDGIEFDAPPDFALPDLSNVSGTDLKTKSVASGMLQQDLEDVNIQKLDEKIQITDTVKSLSREQTGLNAEIGRLRTEIGTGILPTYTFRGKAVPTIPTTKYKAYYLHFIVLKDGNQQLTIPANSDEGTVFSIENNDRTDAFTLRPPSGETINGSNSAFQCAGDTLNFFVKSGKDWVLAFGGIFPNNITSLMSTIKANLVGQLNTIDEIKAQLKDRLHTFREIQNEFSDQLHTFPEIATDMESKGFLKEGGKFGMQGDQSVPLNDNWAIDAFRANQEVLIPAQNKGNQYLVFTLPPTTSAIISKIIVNGSEIEFTKNDFVDNELYYKVFVAESTVDSSQVIRLKLEFEVSSGNGGGIEIDDGTTDAASINKINVQGIEITKNDVQGEVDLRSITEWENLGGTGGGSASRVLTETPLENYLNPSAPANSPQIKLYIKHDYFELKKPPGYLAYLVENEEIIGRNKQETAGVKTGTIWFDDIVVGSDGFIEIDKSNKAIGIQDYTEDDPNITGGIPTLIAFRAAMKGKAPNDGFVEILLKKTSEGTPTQDGGFLLDANDQPIGVKKQFKAGDNLGTLDAMAIYMAKGVTKFQCLLEHNFVDDGVMLEDRTEGASGLLIQALGPDYATGDALLQFENDTMQNIEMSKHYNGEDIFNIAWALNYDRAEVDITPGTGSTTVDGLHFYNNTNLKVGVANKTITITDNGSDLCYFNLGYIFSAEKTLMLRNKDLDVKVTLQDKDSGYRIYLAKWLGIPDKYTNKIIDSYSADSGAIAETNWELDGSVFITEDITSGEHEFDGTLTVPSDANNFAIIIVPVTEQQPITLKLKGFEVNVHNPFYGWILEAPELIGEKHLEFSKQYKELICNKGGYAATRYTLNDSPASGIPMPIGALGKGSADIDVDHTINQVVGSALPQFEGAIRFQSEGKAIIDTSLYIWSEKAANVISQVNFWYSKVSLDGQTFTKIPLSEFTIGIKGGTKAIYRICNFELDVEAGDRIALFGLADQSDGAFIETNVGNIPMLKTTIEFNEITQVENDVANLMQHADEVVFVKSGVPVVDPENYKMEIDIETGKTTIKVVKS